MGTPSRKPKTVDDVQKQVEAEKAVDSKSRQIADRNRRAALTLAKDLTPEKVSADMTDLGLKLSRTLSDARQKVIEKLEQHDQIEIAIAAKQKELEGLFDKEIVAMDLAALIEDRASVLESINKLEAEATEKSEAITRKLALQKIEEEHKLALARAQEESEHAEKKRNERLAADQAYAVKHQELAAKEKEFAAKQAKYDELLKLEAELPTKIASEVKAAEARAGNAAKKLAEDSWAIEKKQLEFDKHLAEKDRDAFEARKEDLEAQVEKLQARLDESSKRIVEVATSGLSSFGTQASASLSNGRDKSKSV